MRRWLGVLVAVGTVCGVAGCGSEHDSGKKGATPDAGGAISASGGTTSGTGGTGGTATGGAATGGADGLDENTYVPGHVYECLGEGPYSDCDSNNSGGLSDTLCDDIYPEDVDEQTDYCEGISAGAYCLRIGTESRNAEAMIVTCTGGEAQVQDCNSNSCAIAPDGLSARCR